MPKVTIEFSLPDEREEYEITHRAAAAHSAIWAALEAFRAKAKWSDDPATTWDAAYALLCEHLGEFR